MRIAGLIAIAAFLPAIAYASLININTADAKLLDTLSGIGPAKAAAIVEYRTQYGPFAAIEDIQKVSGIGPATFASIKTSITVGTSAGAMPPQPSAVQPSYSKVQAVEPIISTKPNSTTHEEAVRAPAAATEIAGAGAALPLPSRESRAAGLFRSPWTLGLLGVVLLAGGAFIFL